MKTCIQDMFCIVDSFYRKLWMTVSVWTLGSELCWKRECLSLAATFYTDNKNKHVYSQLWMHLAHVHISWMHWIEVIGKNKKMEGNQGYNVSCGSGNRKEERERRFCVCIWSCIASVIYLCCLVPFKQDSEDAVPYVLWEQMLPLLSGVWLSRQTLCHKNTWQ